MKRASTIFAAAAALALSAVFSAGTASASASTTAVIGSDTPETPETPDSPPEDDREWERYRDFPNYLLCESAGATGVIMGRWDDWWCDDDDVLWVER